MIGVISGNKECTINGLSGVPLNPSPVGSQVVISQHLLKAAVSEDWPNGSTYVTVIIQNPRSNRYRCIQIMPTLTAALLEIPGLITTPQKRPFLEDWLVSVSAVWPAFKSELNQNHGTELLSNFTGCARLSKWFDRVSVALSSPEI